MNRREFLQMSLMLSATGLLAACQLEIDHEDGAGQRDLESIIVIGAGMAGLSAARQLQNVGHQVTVLEGRDRIGGRVWTSRAWSNAPLDMGASWIHGVEGNPITELADTVNAERLATDDADDTVYDVDGTELGEKEAESIWALAEDILWPAIVAAQVNILSDDYSIQEAIESMVSRDTMSLAEQQRLDFLLNSIVEHCVSGDTSELSAKYALNDDEFGGEDVIFPDGYDAIPYYLAQGLEIKLEHIVERIAYTEEGVVITTSQGEFRADRAVVTLPLGVLKHGGIEFDPPLPEEKRDAIEKLGMGVLNKTYLQFEEAFWPKELGMFNYISTEKGEWAEWFNMEYYIDQPILLGFNAAHYGRAIESRTDEEIVTAAMDVLRTIYGSEIPEPEAWQITRWASDPFAYGSYSFAAVGANQKTRERLAQPVNDRLFFAGEATSAHYPSTVHGAYLSGVRAAKEIEEYR